jgi:hypothetical protein
MGPQEFDQYRVVDTQRLQHCTRGFGPISTANFNYNSFAFTHNTQGCNLVIVEK